MPGSSLWLLPPEDSPLNAVLATLIEKTSLRFNSPHRFLPHVTLTSNISPSVFVSDPQFWLECLGFPPEESVSVVLEGPASEDDFFRKLYIKCTKGDGLQELAAACRQEVDGYGDFAKAKQWVENEYNPHLSLMYHGCPKIDNGALEEVNKLARELSTVVDDMKMGWKGGRVVLLPTDKPIEEWIPVATREL